MHPSDTSSIAQHLKKIMSDKWILENSQNNKKKLQILETLHYRNMQPKINRINFESSVNVLKCH